MLRLRRLPPTRVLRRPVYEIEAGPSDAHPAGWSETTTTPATLIDTEIGVEEAWDLVAAADAAWTSGVGPWVSPDGLPGAQPGEAEPPPSGDLLADRAFELWEYAAGHGGLLIRSPRRPGLETNVDLVFDKVQYVACPKTLPDLALGHPEPADVDRVTAALGGAVEPPARLFVLLSGSGRHLVVARSCRVIEHLGDPTDSPFDPVRFSRDWWSGLFNGR